MINSNSHKDLVWSGQMSRLDSLGRRYLYTAPSCTDAHFISRFNAIKLHHTLFYNTGNAMIIIALHFFLETLTFNLVVGSNYAVLAFSMTMKVDGREFKEKFSI